MTSLQSSRSKHHTILKTSPLKKNSTKKEKLDRCLWTAGLNRTLIHSLVGRNSGAADILIKAPISALALRKLLFGSLCVSVSGEPYLWAISFLFMARLPVRLEKLHARKSKAVNVIASSIFIFFPSPLQTFGITGV